MIRIHETKGGQRPSHKKAKPVGLLVLATFSALSLTGCQSWYEFDQQAGECIASVTNVIDKTFISEAQRKCSREGDCDLYHKLNTETRKSDYDHLKYPVIK